MIGKKPPRNTLPEPRRYQPQQVQDARRPVYRTPDIALASKWAGTAAKRRVNMSSIRSAHKNIAALEGRIAKGASAQRGGVRLAELREELRLRTATDRGELLAVITTPPTT